jgi:hypothetical protein
MIFIAISPISENNLLIGQESGPNIVSDSVCGQLSGWWLWIPARIGGADPDRLQIEWAKP